MLTILVLIAAMFAPAIRWLPANPAADHPQTVPAGLVAAIHSSLGPGPVHIAATGHTGSTPEITRAPDGWRASVPAMSLSATIARNGSVSLTAGDGAPRSAFSPTSITYSASESVTEPVRVTSSSPASHGSALVQDAGVLHTSYRSTSAGVEQTFGIDDAPRGTTSITVDIGTAPDWKVTGAHSLGATGPLSRYGLTYSGLTATDAGGRVLPSRFVKTGTEFGITVVTEGAHFPLRIDPTWSTSSAPNATLTNGGGANNDDMGFSVSLSSDGTTALVGAIGAGGGKGAVYVFHVASETAWTTSAAPSATLTNAGASVGDDMGISVALSSDGTTALLGAIGVSTGKGAVYVFHVASEGSWATSGAPTATLTNAGASNGDSLGTSVALSSDGTTALLGASGVSTGKGAVYVFHVASEGSWATSGAPTATLTNAGASNGDSLGISAAMSSDGTTALLGATGVSTGKGAVYVFHVAAESSWVTSGAPTATLTNGGGANGDAVGKSVAFSSDGTTAILGANGVSLNKGAAYIFHVAAEGSWVTSAAPTATLTNGGGAGGDSFGISTVFSPDGTTVIVGASNATANKGAAYVFQVAGESSWVTSTVPKATLSNAGGAGGDFLGVAVSLSSDLTTAFVGADGVSTSKGASYVFEVPLPSVTSIAPTAGPLGGGTAVTVTGTNFTGATAVNFGATPGTGLVVNSSTSITITSPAEAAGTVDITVLTPSGTSITNAGDKFTYTSAPTVTSIAPTLGPVAGGTSVTVTGTGFTGATAVNFGSTAGTSLTVVSATSITIVSPAESAGVVDVTVVAPGGTSATSSADKFTYAAAPTVTAVFPPSGPIAGGTAVTVTGTNFTGATAANFGATPGTSLNVVSATSITVTSPAEAAGTVDIIVVTPGGASATGAPDQFTYSSAPPPTVTSVTPNLGNITGGAAVTLTGTGFTGATTVKFGTVPGTAMKVVSSTSITVTAPPEPAGTVDITVIGPGGTSATGSADLFTYETLPVITSIAPTWGQPSGGTSVTITGTSLAGVSAVKFGPNPATSFTFFASSQNTQVIATSPAGTAGQVDITVTTPIGTSTTSVHDKFTYATSPPPTVTAVSPAVGATTGGGTVTVTGTNFTGATGVSFGTAAGSNISVVSATSLTVTYPSGSVGSVDVTVTTVQGTSPVSPADTFTYTTAPTVFSVTPAAGPPAGGQSVVVNGINFTGATTVNFGPTFAVSVTFFTVNSNFAIAVTTPAEPAGTVDVTVTAPGGTSALSASDKYTYTTAPIVTSVSPSSGLVTGGTAVTISGFNFTGATQVKFGGAVAPSFTVTSATSISVVSPVGSVGPYDVTVTGPSGTSATSPADIFTFTGQGYWIAAANGAVYPFGGASFLGSMAGSPLAFPIVGIAATPDGNGYWLVALDGGIFAFGDAVFHGSTGGIALHLPIIGMSVTPDGGGYWLVAEDGGIFSFGDAVFFGSTGGIALNQPIVAMASTPDGQGYWLVALDGGIFAFGDAVFFGSTGGIALSRPITGMAPTPDGKGYWLVAEDGGIFAFGDAPALGSLGGTSIPSYVIGMAV